MRAKEIAILVVFILFTLPLLMKVVVYSSSVGNQDVDTSTEQAAELIEEAAVPWWVGIIDWLADLGTFGALLIIGLIVFLMWIGEIKSR